VEAVAQSYAGLPFQAYAIDVWDGAEPQAEIFTANSGVTFPLLLRGAQGGILSHYNTTYHYMFVIDGDGVIAWRGDFVEATVRAAIDEAITPLADRPTAWGAVQSLYR